VAKRKSFGRDFYFSSHKRASFCPVPAIIDKLEKALLAPGMHFLGAGRYSLAACPLFFSPKGGLFFLKEPHSCYSLPVLPTNFCNKIFERSTRSSKDPRKNRKSVLPFPSPSFRFEIPQIGGSLLPTFAPASGQTFLRKISPPRPK